MAPMELFETAETFDALSNSLSDSHTLRRRRVLWNHMRCSRLRLIVPETLLLFCAGAPLERCYAVNGSILKIRLIGRLILFVWSPLKFTLSALIMLSGD